MATVQVDDFDDELVEGIEIKSQWILSNSGLDHLKVN